MTRASTITFRNAQLGDASALAAFQVRAWKENYRDFLPRWSLDAVTVEDRSEAWRMILRAPRRHGASEVILAECGGAVAGFAAAGHQRSERLRRLGYGGEISAIYVDRAWQGSGLGRRLLSRVFAGLGRLGERRASLWIIRENRKARGFAEALGAELLDPGAGGRLHALDDVAYGWRRLDLCPKPVPVASLTGKTRADLAARSVSLARPALHNGADT